MSIKQQIENQKLKIKMLEAYLEGKVIQWYHSGDNEWRSEPTDRDSIYMPDYLEWRIKPEPKYKRFTLTNAQCLLDKVVIQKQTYERYVIKGIGLNDVCLMVPNQRLSHTVNYEYLLKDYVFEDYQPVGVQVNE